MPLDIQLSVYDRVWTLLTGSPAFLANVKRGNMLDERYPNKPTQADVQSAPADYPKVWVSVVEENDNNPRGPRTFGMNTVGTTMAEKVNYVVPMTLNILIRITYDTTVIQFQTPVEAAIRGALFLKGPTMGLHYVNNTEWRGVKRRPEKSGNTVRTVAELRWVAYCLPYLSELTAGSYYL